MAEQEQPLTRVKGVLDDPSAQAIARVYANAFLDAAASVDVESALEEFTSFLDDVLERNSEFESLLLSGMVNRDQKLGLIDRVVAPFGSELFTRFLRVLAQHDRLELLPLIMLESQTGHDDRSGRKRVQISSAKDLTEAQTERIRRRLDETFSFEPVLETKTDPSLLGGLVIQVDDTVYDSSLRTRMKQFRDRLCQRSLHEIQSGRDRFSHPEGD